MILIIKPEDKTEDDVVRAYILPNANMYAAVEFIDVSKLSIRSAVIIEETVTIKGTYEVTPGSIMILASGRSVLPQVNRKNYKIGAGAIGITRKDYRELWENYPKEIVKCFKAVTTKAPMFEAELHEMARTLRLDIDSFLDAITDDDLEYKSSLGYRGLPNEELCLFDLDPNNIASLELAPDHQALAKFYGDCYQGVSDER